MVIGVIAKITIIFIFLQLIFDHSLLLNLSIFNFNIIA